MVNLDSLINNYGFPKVLIDYQNQTKKVVFNFDEVIYMDQNQNVFINDKIQSGDPMIIWQDCIDQWKLETTNNEISALGFFSYDFKNILYPNHRFKKHDDIIPLFWFGKPSNVISMDNCQYNYQKQLMNIDKSLQKLHDYNGKIEKIKSYLYDGDVYQINYTQPLIFDFNQNPFDLYMQIRQKANPVYGFYLDIADSQFLSFSPEKFFVKKTNLISSYPIKGTIKRVNNTQKDLEQIKLLSNSKKDKAEHLMIVDLLRNDIGKISKFGTVNVNDLFKIKTFETIHHMESEIQGVAYSNIKEIDIFKALFPGGSITGAPKYRAIQIIDELESYNRGIYTGCLGTISPNGDMDFNVCIRTMTINNNKAVYPVGGGIVWDSNSELEYNEAKEKANILDDF